VGLILDSSVLIAYERCGENVRQMANRIVALSGDGSLAISVISLTELAHGAARAATTQQRSRRLRFIQDLAIAMPMQPVSTSIALRAGEIDGETHAMGVRVPLADLLIGVTALELGYTVATSNFRHFQQIPGLSVLRF
jgi:tRNA(fMet)-specific endonuclease VapC